MKALIHGNLKKLLEILVLIKNKMARALEILWFCIGVFTLGLGVNRSATFSFKENYQLFIISIIAFSLFLLRRKLRKTYKKENQ